MDCDNDYSPERKGVEIPSCEIEPHLLISSVRKSYLKYMTRLLCENYVGWCGERPPKDVLRAARDMELKAAAKAMMVPMYRVAILSMINSVKKCTANQDLCPEVEDSCIKSRSRSKGTQTDPIDTYTLHQTSKTAIENKSHHKTDNIELKSLHEHKTNVTHNSVTKLNDTDKSSVKLNELDIFDTLMESSVDHNVTSEQSKRCSKLSFSSDDDNLMLEMEKLFKTDNADSEDDIFDSFMGDNQVKMILEEINQYGNTTADKSQHKQNDSTIIVEESVEKVKELAVGSSSSLEKRLEEMMKPVGCSVVSSTQPPPKKKYVYSRWPCELFYQKKKLQVKLDQICERSLKLHAKVKERFVDLFGYDSSEEETMQSPDTSESFLRSCQQRAAPYVVRHLQPYLRKRRLTRTLCRPLATHLLKLLVNVNQYPDDYECFLFVKEYFQRRPRIRCMADF